MHKKYTYFIVIFLIVASLIVYGRILDNSFINFDDEAYITNNNYIKSGINTESIKWAFTGLVCNNWHPLTWLSHILDWSLFHDHAGGHHLISLLLHIGSVLFLFFFLNKTTKNLWLSAFAAALFALHPLRVESVAWASERKDVLSMFFGLASIYAYSCYAESSKLSQYFLCLILFVLSLMAKPMLVTLPFVLLLLDYWPLGRWQKVLAPVKVPATATEKSEKKKVKRRKADSINEKKISTPINSRSHLISRLLWEKAPFLLLTIILSIVTLWVQNETGAVVSMERLSFSGRFANAIISYVSYLGKTFWPIDLAVFYPYEPSLPLGQVLASCFILIGITIVVIYAVKQLPFIFVGWFWYLGTLIPVIGLVQVGKQAMADRYTYLPSIGIAIILVWGIPLLFSREDMRKKILFPAGIAVLTILAVLTWQQCGYWKNSTTLFSHALRITKDNYLAQSSLATALAQDGKTEEAIDHYKKAIDIYKKAIHIIPMDQARAYANRGICYARLTRYQQAIEDYNEAIRIIPSYADAYFNRGNAYSSIGQYQKAIESMNEALRLQPDYFATYFNRGNAYFHLNQFKQAIEDYNHVIRLNENFAGAYSNRGTVYFNQGNKELGCRDAQKVCALGVCKMLEEAKSKGLCR